VLSLKPKQQSPELPYKDIGPGRQLYSIFDSADFFQLLPSYFNYTLDQQMETPEEKQIVVLKNKILDFINGKRIKIIAIPHFPSQVLNMAIAGALNISINEKPLFEVLSEYHFLCCIYQEWKSHYLILLNAYRENSPVNLTIAGINPKYIFARRQQFEDLFSEIDSLQIFESVDF
jgi:hypothetical protein